MDSCAPPFLHYNLTLKPPSGTSIKLYGNTREVIGGALRFVLDGGVNTIKLNDTTFHDGVTPMYQADNMEDGDHQFSCDLIQSTSGSAEIDYLECVIPSPHAIPRIVCQHLRCLQHLCCFQDWNFLWGSLRPSQCWANCAGRTPTCDHCRR